MATQRRQIDVAKVSIHDLLPADVQDRVVWRSDYWLPGEACSTYAFSETLVSMDNHSPIFALTMGTPAIFLRHTTDTINGEMWPDLGLGDWLVETDATDCEDIPQTPPADRSRPTAPSPSPASPPSWPASTSTSAIPSTSSANPLSPPPLAYSHKVFSSSSACSARSQKFSTPPRPQARQVRLGSP